MFLKTPKTTRKRKKPSAPQPLGETPVPRRNPPFDEMQTLFTPFIQRTKEKQNDRGKILVIFEQHALGSTVKLIRGMLKAGVLTANLFGINKMYSTDSRPEVKEGGVPTELQELGIYLQKASNPKRPGTYPETFARDIQDLNTAVEKRLKEIPHCSKIIILGDGARLAQQLPEQWQKRTVIIEQTTKGARELKRLKLNCSCILLAEDPAKRQYEPPMIANIMVEKLEKKFGDKKRHFGVIGLGAIGKAIAAKLAEKGHKLYVYDEDPKKLNQIDGASCCNLLPDLIRDSEIIIGCTGEDVFQGLTTKDLAKCIKENKYILSASSEDIEVLTLFKLLNIREYPNGDPLADIAKNFNGHKMTICRGGFPFNFSTDTDPDPKEEFVLIRGLLLAAFYQALGTDVSKRTGHQILYLDREQVEKIVKIWKKHRKKPFGVDVDQYIAELYNNSSSFRVDFPTEAKFEARSI
jgi:hypothetical protein